MDGEMVVRRERSVNGLYMVVLKGLSVAGNGSNWMLWWWEVGLQRGLV